MGGTEAKHLSNLEAGLATTPWVWTATKVSKTQVFFRNESNISDRCYSQSATANRSHSAEVSFRDGESLWQTSNSLPTWVPH
jgi:hypothetical protein